MQLIQHACWRFIMARISFFCRSPCSSRSTTSRTLCRARSMPCLLMSWSGGATALRTCAFDSYDHICGFSASHLVLGTPLCRQHPGRLWRWQVPHQALCGHHHPHGSRQRRPQGQSSRVLLQHCPKRCCKELQAPWPCLNEGPSSQPDAIPQGRGVRPVQVWVGRGGLLSTPAVVGGHPHAPRWRGVRRLHPDRQPQPGRCAAPRRS